MTSTTGGELGCVMLSSPALRPVVAVFQSSDPCSARPSRTATASHVDSADVQSESASVTRAESSADSARPAPASQLSGKKVYRAKRTSRGKVKRVEEVLHDGELAHPLKGLARCGNVRVEAGDAGVVEVECRATLQRRWENDWMSAYSSGK